MRAQSRAQYPCGWRRATMWRTLALQIPYTIRVRVAGGCDGRPRDEGALQIERVHFLFPQTFRIGQENPGDIVARGNHSPRPRRGHLQPLLGIFQQRASRVPSKIYRACIANDGTDHHQLWAARRGYHRRDGDFGRSRRWPGICCRNRARLSSTAGGGHRSATARATISRSS